MLDEVKFHKLDTRLSLVLKGYAEVRRIRSPGETDLGFELVDVVRLSAHNSATHFSTLEPIARQPPGCSHSVKAHCDHAQIVPYTPLVRSRSGALIERERPRDSLCTPSED